jgi:hypothetical protein
VAGNKASKESESEGINGENGANHLAHQRNVSK